MTPNNVNRQTAPLLMKQKYICQKKKFAAETFRKEKISLKGMGKLNLFREKPDLKKPCQDNTYTKNLSRFQTNKNRCVI